MKADYVVLGVCLTILAVAALAGELLPSKAVSAHRSEYNYVFVLDAGHGGEDGGASSASGMKESNINLAIVLKVDQLMGFCGAQTVLTRNEDRSIHDPSAETIREKKVSDLHNRVALVESITNAALISVHQNSFTDSRYSGAQVFYSSVSGSQMWGDAAQETLRLILDADNERAAKPIPDTVYLMDHVTCPAILVECGFLSNREEAERLSTSDYQKKIAIALTGSCLQLKSLDIFS